MHGFWRCAALLLTVAIGLTVVAALAFAKA